MLMPFFVDLLFLGCVAAQICGCQLKRLLPQLRRAPRLLVTSADSLYKAAAGLQQMLKLSEEGLTLVVRR